MQTFNIISGDEWTVTANNKEEAQAKWDAYWEQESCPCGEEDCLCVEGGQVGNSEWTDPEEGTITLTLMEASTIMNALYYFEKRMKSVPKEWLPARDKVQFAIDEHLAPIFESLKAGK